MYPAQWTLLNYSLPAQNAAKGMSSHATGFTGYSKFLCDNLLLLCRNTTRLCLIVAGYLLPVMMRQRGRCFKLAQHKDKEYNAKPSSLAVLQKNTENQCN